jgi:hypothetical protein
VFQVDQNYNNNNNYYYMKMGGKETREMIKKIMRLILTKFAVRK